MIYKIQMTRQARIDMHEIFEYIALVLKVPQHALRQVGRIETQIQKLNHFPERFKIYEREPWQSRGLHQMAVDNFVVFYFVEDENVTIIRIMYEGRDIREQLR